MGSRGSVIPFFLEAAKKGEFYTDLRMTRFNISLDDGTVGYFCNNELFKEKFRSKIPSYKIADVAEAIGPSCEKVVGIRLQKNS